MIPAELDFRFLKRAVSIEQVLAHRGLLDRLRLRAHCLVGPCPVHGGDSPRAFFVDRHQGLWHCFTACDGGGDVVELVRRLDRRGHAAAARYLASLQGRPTALPAPPPPRAPVPFRPFTARLTLDPHAPLLRQKGIRPDTARAHQVGAWKGRGLLAGCVALRLHDPNGQPWGYAGRRVEPGAIRRLGKWVFPTRLPKRQILYGFHRARPHLRQGLVVVECPWGVLRLAQLRIPAVALLGTHLSDAQRRLLQRARRIVLALDGDRAGRQATRRILQTLRDRIDLLPLHLPEGRDPDDMSDEQLTRALRPLLPS